MSQTTPHIAFENLVRSFSRFEDRIALIDKDGSCYTYGRFKQHIVGARSMLVKKGVKKGSRVLVFVPMSMELYAVLEGLFSLGATAIFLDPWMKGKRMSEVIRQVKPDLFVVTKKINRVAWILPSTWFLKRWVVGKIQPLAGEWQIEAVSDEDNALITFTSGTGGKPKGANRTFAFLHAQAEALKSHMIAENDEHYVDYTNFPIVGLADFAIGNTVVVPRINLMKIHKAHADLIADHLTGSAINRVIVSPSLLKKIAEGHSKLNQVTEIVTGGAPISNTLIKTCITHFKQAKLEAIYGSTEAEPICLASFQQIFEKFDEPLKGVFVGKPVDAVRIKIIDPVNGHISTGDFEKVQLKEGETGEIVVTGNHVNKNYYNNPEAFRQNKIIDASNDIWHRTGDIGYFENGFLYLVGRDHRIMNNNGKKIYPYPAEQFIEKEFGFTDVGYVQNRKGEFTLWIGSTDKRTDTHIRAAMDRVGYPVDYIEMRTSPLPRDARHQSKLQTDHL